MHGFARRLCNNRGGWRSGERFEDIKSEKMETKFSEQKRLEIRRSRGESLKRAVRPRSNYIILKYCFLNLIVI